MGLVGSGKVQLLSFSNAKSVAWVFCGRTICSMPTLSYQYPTCVESQLQATIIFVVGSVETSSRSTVGLLTVKRFGSDWLICPQAVNVTLSLASVGEVPVSPGTGVHWPWRT